MCENRSNKFWKCDNGELIDVRRNAPDKKGKKPQKKDQCDSQIVCNDCYFKRRVVQKLRDKTKKHSLYERYETSDTVTKGAFELHHKLDDPLKNGKDEFILVFLSTI